MTRVWTYVDENELKDIAENSPLSKRVIETLAQTSEEVAYLEAAQTLHHRDGDLEIDDDATVSLSDDGGAYVLAWIWVSAEDAGLPSDEH